MDWQLRRAFSEAGTSAEKAGASAAPCPDAELLAAFSDGDLADEERRAIVEHTADCQRCSAILALSTSAADDAAAATGPTALRTSSRWRHAYWSVPLATAATIAALWVATPREAVAPTRTIITSAERPVPPNPQAAPGSVAPSSASPPIAARESAQSGSTSANGSLRRSQPEADVFSSRDDLADSTAGSAAQTSTPEARREAAAAAPSPAAPPSAVPAPAASPSAPLNETITVAEQPEVSRVPQVTEQLRVVSAVEFSSPVGGTRWRVRGTAVERSVNDGTTWVTEYQAPRSLVTGVALSPEIAWAAGDAGLVMRRTAGGWAIVTPPAQQTIVAIRATSATTVTVTFAGGRTMQTTDAGASWR